MVKNGWSAFAGDEFSVNIQTDISHVWVKKGTRLRVPTHTKGGKVNVIGALNNKTGKVFTSLCEKINRFSFLKFLKKLLGYYDKVFLIIDNASWHRAKIVKEFVKKNRHRLTIEYFPPYSPEYNPAEPCWKSIKKDLLTSRLFLSVAGMGDQIKEYFKRRFFNYKLERYLSP